MTLSSCSPPGVRTMFAPFRRHRAERRLCSGPSAQARRTRRLRRTDVSPSFMIEPDATSLEDMLGHHRAGVPANIPRGPVEPLKIIVFAVACLRHVRAPQRFRWCRPLVDPCRGHRSSIHCRSCVPVPFSVSLNLSCWNTARRSCEWRHRKAGGSHLTGAYPERIRRANPRDAPVLRPASVLSSGRADQKAAVITRPSSPGSPTRKHQGCIGA